MPTPIVTFTVEDTTAGRRIFKDSAEASINSAISTLFSLIAAIPSGPEGPRGPVGLTGDRWVTGTPREFAEGLSAVVGNVIYRKYPASSVTALFRCLQTTVTNNSNFPVTPTSNTTWELILLVPYGERGATGLTGERGPVGPQGASAEVIEFDTDAAALAYSVANPLAIVISKEGL